jgi:hypothetical protein
MPASQAKRPVGRPTREANIYYSAAKVSGLAEKLAKAARDAAMVELTRQVEKAKKTGGPDPLASSKRTRARIHAVK